MSLLPMTKKCDKCKKTYSYNPSIGKGLFCPYCAGTGKVLKEENRPKGRNQ